MADHPSHWEAIKELPELSVVRLAVATTDDGVTFPRGTMGTIVHVHSGHDAYEVEFSDPEPGVVTLERADIEPA